MRDETAVSTYFDLKDKLDSFSEAWVELESFFPFSSVAPKRWQQREHWN